MDQRPNLLLLMTDTQPPLFVGCYAGEDRGTPRLDALAAEGTRFDACYTSSPLCTPARAGLFTGMTPSRSGANTNSQPLGETVRTMGQLFSDAGYRSAYIGKWHLDGHDYFGDGVCPPGWEDAYWYDGKRYLLELTPQHREFWRTSPMTPEALRKNEFGREHTWAHRIGTRAERFLEEQHKDQPWLLVCSYDEPHHPYACPAEYAEKWEGASIPIGPSAFDSLEGKPAHQHEWAASELGISEPDGRFYNGSMLACNSFVDGEIGRVVDAAKKWSKANGRPTWIIYTADHGDHIGTHRLSNKGPTAYEMNVRVPLIVVTPEDDGEGRVQKSVVSTMDVLSTMLDIAGIDRPAALDGESFAPLCSTEKPARERSAFIEYHRYETGHDGFGGFEPMRAFVKWPYKLVINLMRTDELYHLESDPHEMENLIDSEEHAAHRDRLHQELVSWMNEHEDPQRGQHWERRPWHQIDHKIWVMGQFPRPVRSNGKQPPYRDYGSGLPSKY